MLPFRTELSPGTFKVMFMFTVIFVIIKIHLVEVSFNTKWLFQKPASKGTGYGLKNAVKHYPKFTPRIIIKPENTTYTGNKIYLACMVISKAENLNFRTRIRKTWGNTYNGNAACDRLLFVLAHHPKGQRFQNLRSEAEIHNDIVLGDATDKSQNPMIAARTGFRYVALRWQRVRYVLAARDEMLVNAKFLRRYLHTMENQTNFISCKVMKNIKVVRDKLSVLYVSRDAYTPATLPNYCSGAAYIMSEGVVGILNTHLDKVPNLLMDYVTITGLARLEASIKKVFDKSEYYNLNPYNGRLDANTHIFFKMDKASYHSLWQRTV